MIDEEVAPVEVHSTQLPVEVRADTALSAPAAKAELSALAAQYQHLASISISDRTTRDQVHGAAMTLKRARTAVERRAKEVRDDSTKFSKAVIATEKSLIAIVEPLEATLISLRDAWDQAEKARKEEEARIEAARKKAIADRIADIKSYRELAQQSRTSAMVQTLIDKLRALWEGYDVKAVFEEFADDAGVAYRVTLQHMEATLKQKRDAEAEAERQRQERERLAEERRQQEAEAARLAAEREAFERERAAFAEQQRLAAEKEAWEAKWGGLHPNGAPKYSRTTFKDNGEPIMLDADGKRSVFCDLGGSDGTAESMVDLSDVAQVQPVESAVESAIVNGTAWVQHSATDDGVKVEHIPAGSVLDEEEEAGVIAGFDEAINAPMATKADNKVWATDEAPPAEHLVTVLAMHYGVPASTAIDWLVIRADDILNLGDEVQA